MTRSMVGTQSLCLALCYRTPAASVRGLLPIGLEPVTRGPWAFWRVVVRQVERWRSTNISSWTAESDSIDIGAYRHISYQLLVQAMTDRADLLRGYYPVRNDVDVSPADAGTDQLMLDPSPHHASIRLHDEAGQWAVTVRSDDDNNRGDVTIRTSFEPPRRAADSCFPSLTAATAFLHPPALRMLIDSASSRLALTRMEIETGPTHNAATPVSIAHARFAFFEALGQHEVALELAQRLVDTQTRWTPQPTVGVMVGPLQHQALPRRHAALPPSPADTLETQPEPALAMP